MGHRGQLSGHGGTVGLLGREPERARSDEVIAALRTGESRVLVLRGPPGVGKSALLEYAEGAATGVRVLRVAGVESEMELEFAALHQLCAPLLDRRKSLPAPQRDALETVFGMRGGLPPDHFLVGLAVLGLLSEASEERPLLCVIDDAQWVDRASVRVLAFVARRLLAESVAVLFGTRLPGPELRGLPELEVAGLPDAEAHTLLRSGTRAAGPAHLRSDRRGDPG